MKNFSYPILVVAMMSAAGTSPSSGADLTKEAHIAMKKGVAFYSRKVAIQGGYVYQYSDDLAKKEGEGVTDSETVWVQPPGTPFVGLAYLDAYELTHQEYLLEAANSAADCLIRGQLRSGGWSESIFFAAEERSKRSYRVDPMPKGKKTPFNVTTFDDNKSQSAMRFLMKLDKLKEFKDARLHEAVTFALESTLKAQYPIGAWPQGYDTFPEPGKYPVKAASYPETWPRTMTVKYYHQFYTLNDNALMDVIDVMLLAYDTYSDKKYLEAAKRGGDFLILAQMPKPQPAWAQQYDFDMHPCWARRFEPPAITGEESQGALQALLQVYAATGDRKYLKPIPPAIDFLKRSLLPNNELARFYELSTNKPLYMTKTYELTYDDSDIPTHYSFKVPARLEQISRDYEQLAALKNSDLDTWRHPPKKTPGKPSPSLEREAANAIESLDSRGAWVEDGKLKYHGKGDSTRRIISSTTFSKHLKAISRYIAASEANTQR